MILMNTTTLSAWILVSMAVSTSVTSAVEGVESSLRGRKVTQVHSSDRGLDMTASFSVADLLLMRIGLKDNGMMKMDHRMIGIRGILLIGMMTPDLGIVQMIDNVIWKRVPLENISKQLQVSIRGILFVRIVAILKNESTMQRFKIFLQTTYYSSKD